MHESKTPVTSSQVHNIFSLIKPLTSSPNLPLSLIITPQSLFLLNPMEQIRSNIHTLLLNTTIVWECLLDLFEAVFSVVLYNIRIRDNFPASYLQLHRITVVLTYRIELADFLEAERVLFGHCKILVERLKLKFCRVLYEIILYFVVSFAGVSCVDGMERTCRFEIALTASKSIVVECLICYLDNVVSFRSYRIF